MKKLLVIKFLISLLALKDIFSSARGLYERVELAFSGGGGGGGGALIILTACH